MTTLSRIGVVLLVFTLGCDVMTYDVYRQARDGIASASEETDGGSVVEQPDGGSRPEVSEIGIEAGPFVQGCLEWLDPACEADEKPAREVMLGAFAIDQFEVTTAAFQACVQARGCEVPSCAFEPMEAPGRPVTCVNWAQAASFCEWMGRRLPTEAEWERASRGPSDRVYTWGVETPACQRTPFVGCTSLVAQVGSHPDDASESGVRDLAGNVAEWVADWYDPQTYAFDTTADPRGPLVGEFRVVRGGSVMLPASSQRASDRAFADAMTTSETMGFRCARTVLSGGGR